MTSGFSADDTKSTFFFASTDKEQIYLLVMKATLNTKREDQKISDGPLKLSVKH